jgi:ribonuclease Z
MHSLFRPRLVNGPLGDPGLFIPFQFDRRALIFDLGDLSPLPARELLKISHAFVTHTHMDHFVGFDPLLRCLLGREKDVALFGPTGFLRNVEGKLAAYTWDLVDPQSCPLRLHVTEVRSGGMLRRSFVCGDGFAPQGEPRALPFTGTLLAEPAFRVDAAVLAHSTDCLGLAITERFHINILTPGLEALGLAPGPWLNRFKAAIYEGRDPESDFDIGTAVRGDGRGVRLGELARTIARITPGRKIAYVSDVGDTPANREAIAGLASDADLLFIEAAFLDADRDRAAARHHLTARQAGEIASRAGARRFTLFHYSPRYAGREAEIEAEARAAAAFAVR